MKTTTGRPSRRTSTVLAISGTALFAVVFAVLWLAEPAECSQTVSHNAAGVSYRGEVRCPVAPTVGTIVLIGLFATGWLALLTWTLRRRQRGEEASREVPFIPS